MADYKRMYAHLFGEVTGALEELHLGEVVEAEYRLKKAQMKCEEIFLCTEADICVIESPKTIEIPKNENRME